MGLIIPYHTVGRLANHEVAAAPRIPTFAAAADRAAHWAGARRRPVVWALILAAARAFSGRAKFFFEGRLSALLSFRGPLGILLIELLELDLPKRGRDLTQVLPEILDRARQRPFLDLGLPHGHHVLHLPHREVRDEILVEVLLVVVVADDRELLRLAVVL